MVQKVYKLFAGSTHRWNILAGHLGSKKVVSQTKCAARTDAVSAIYEGSKQSTKALMSIANNTETHERPETKLLVCPEK